MKSLDERLEKIKFMFEANAFDIAIKEAKDLVSMIKRIKKRLKG